MNSITDFLVRKDHLATTTLRTTPALPLADGQGVFDLLGQPGHHRLHLSHLFRCC